VIPSPCESPPDVRPAVLAYHPEAGDFVRVLSSGVSPPVRGAAHSSEHANYTYVTTPACTLAVRPRWVTSAAAVPPRQSPMPPPPVKGPLRRFAPLTGSTGTSRPPLWDAAHPANYVPFVVGSTSTGQELSLAPNSGWTIRTGCSDSCSGLDVAPTRAPVSGP
jgi:hypothetical protein